MGRIRKGDYLVVDRVLAHGNRIDRDGVLHSVDVHLKELKAMKEVSIVLLILIIAVWLWKPREGGS